MDASTKWALWGTGVTASFVALEAAALREEITEGKPRGTLTATIRLGLGIQPQARRRFALGAVFVAFWTWFVLHIVAGIGPNNVPGWRRAHQ